MKRLEERSERVRDVIHTTNQLLGSPERPKRSWYEMCLIAYGASQIIAEMERQEDEEPQECPF